MALGRRDHLYLISTTFKALPSQQTQKLEGV